jgi:penicillin-binding protein 1A
LHKTGVLKKNKKRRGPQAKNTVKSTIFRIAIYLLLGILIFPFVLLFAIKTGVIGELPDEQQLSNIRNFEASEIYSADDKLLGRYYIQNRTVIEYEDISENVLNALVATEDERFFEHHGIDYRSLVRVLFRTVLLNDSGGGGGSTITQQLAKNIYGRQHYRYFSILITKLREMLIATDLEDLYTKEEILTLYLNTIPFGENIFGVEAASQRFFLKSAKLLNIQEAATLVGMLKATTYFNPKNHPERSLERRNVVLDQMKKNEVISQQELDSLQKLPIELNYQREDENEGPAPYFREYVRQHLKELLAKISDSLGKSYNLYTDGLKINTTIDSRLQNYAEKAVNRHMRDLQNTFDKHWQGRNKPWEEDDDIVEMVLHQSPVYQSLKANKLSEDSVKMLLEEKRDMEIYSWRGKEKMHLSTMDSILFYLKFLNTGVLSVNPGSGEIKAWVGGINYRFFKYDHVSKNSKRQVGSIFKPLVYASALEQGISPCKYIDAEQKKFVENNEEWQPGNADNNYQGKYSFEGALTESVNTVSVKVLEKAGIKSTIHLANDMGIESDIPEVPSIALGTPSISLYEMVNAYCTFARNGKKTELFYISSIEDNNGNVIWRHPKSKPEQVITSSTSQMIIEMLKNVVNEGTGIRLRTTYNLPNDIAGKTGTTQSNADGWFMAITPKLVTGVWVGGEYPSIHFRTTALGQGANMALPIYALYQQQINRDNKYRNIAQARFPRPPDHILSELDCDPFKDDVNIWEAIFGTKEEREARRVERKQYSKKPVPKKKEKGFFRKLKGLFKKVD